MPTAFKKCTTCDLKWQTRPDFLFDEDIKLIGYQVNFKVLTAGFFLFNHSCGTTLSVTVKDVRNLYDGPVYKERLTGSIDCPGYCLRGKVLDRCPARCECAFVREIMQILLRITKIKS